MCYSATAQGLQKLISGTEMFCNKWKLTINTAKTKIMVLNTRRESSTPWTVYNQEIQVVSSFGYLGIEIDNKGSFKKAVTRLYNKSSKALMSVRKGFNFYYGSAVSVMLKLFDSLVQPILTYGCEIWGVFGWR